MVLEIYGTMATSEDKPHAGKIVDKDIVDT
jgi:hypothetical protein